MNFGEITEYVIRDILRQSRELYEPEMVKRSVIEAHSVIQRMHDWPCMKSHITVAAVPDGFVLPFDVKRVIEVNLVNSDGKKIAMIEPSNMDLNREKVAKNEFYFNWWIEENRLYISSPIGEKIDPTTMPALRIDWYRKLPAYRNPADQDWFSNWANDALSYKAAEIGSVTLWRDERVPEFAAIANARLEDAWKAACEADSAGTAGIYRPPIRIPGGNQSGGKMRGSFYYD